MRIIFLSDSHGDYYALRSVVEKHKNEAEAFLFLGDGEREFDRIQTSYPEKEFFAVKGNNDFMSEKAGSLIVDIKGVRIFMTHGHRYRSPSMIELLRESAEQNGAVAAMFGHTHIPLIDYDAGIYVLNPGSISSPRAGLPSYGILDVTSAGIFPFIVELRGT